MIQKNDDNTSFKQGDLVIGKSTKTRIVYERNGWSVKVLSGTLLNKINSSRGIWEVLCEDGKIVTESEENMDLLSSKNQVS